MKRYFEWIYWPVMVVVMSLIFKSMLGSFDTAFFMAVMMLPSVLFVKAFVKDISYKNRRTGILHTVYFAGAALLIAYQSIMCVYWVVYGFAKPPESDVLLNPVFIWFILAALLSIERLLKIYLFPSEPEEKYLTFTSKWVKVSLEIDTIAYIESRDDEVQVVTVTGRSYPTRMKISQWESVLDSRFIRVHRSYIVNRKHITRFDARAVYLGELPIEISRKYKDAVLAKLE